MSWAVPSAESQSPETPQGELEGGMKAGAKPREPAQPAAEAFLQCCSWIL